LLAISKEFENYRFVKAILRLMPLVEATTTDDYYAVGSTADAAAGVAGVTSVSAVTECAPSAIQSISASASNTSQHTFRGKIFLGKKFLLSASSLKWYQCVDDGNVNPWEAFQYQYIFYNSSGTTVLYNLILDYICEFSSAIPTAFTLLDPGYGVLQQEEDPVVKKVTCDSHFTPGCDCLRCVNKTLQTREVGKGGGKKR